MPSPEQFIDAPAFQSSNKAMMIEEIFAPSNYAAFVQSLKMERQHPETGNKNDKFACFLNMDQADGYGRFSVSEGHSLKYTVKDGDSLWSIVNEALTKKTGEPPAAWKTLETLRKIADQNQLKNPDLIYAGDVLDFSALAGENDGARSFQPERVPSNSNTTDGAASVPMSTNTGVENNPKPEVVTAKPTGTPERDRWYISQAGDGGYWYSCGPTSLTMALAANGLMEPTEANRQKLIRETGTNTDVGFPGTSTKMAEEARKRGLQAEAFDTNDWRAVDAQLSQGRQAIVNGTMVGKSGSLIKHFVYISGKDAAGYYIVGDPASAGTTTWTQKDLNGFLTRGPAPNGFAAVWR